MTLDALLDKAEKKEDAKTMSKMMGSSEDDVRKVNQKRRAADRSKENDGSSCFKCGYDRHAENEECPVIGRTCDYCKKPGHFAKVCFKKLVNAVTESPSSNRETDSTDTDSDYDLIGMVQESKESPDKTLLQVKTNGVSYTWNPDTGAAKDVMDLQQFDNYQRKIGHEVELCPSSKKLYTIGSNKSLNVVGKFRAVLRAGNKSTDSTICVTNEHCPYPLLSESSLLKLGLITYNRNFMTRTSRNKRKASGASRLQVAQNTDVIQQTRKACSHVQRQKSIRDRTEHISKQIDRWQRIDEKQNRCYGGNKVGKEQSVQEDTYPNTGGSLEFRRRYSRIGQNYGIRNVFNLNTGQRIFHGHI